MSSSTWRRVIVVSLGRSWLRRREPALTMAASAPHAANAARITSVTQSPAEVSAPRIFSSSAMSGVRVVASGSARQEGGLP